MSDLSDPRVAKRASVFASWIEEPQAEASLRRRANLGFAGAILLTILLGFFSLYNARKAAEDADWVAHTHDVSATLELALRHLDDVETGGRGFVLTGEESFLEPYDTGKSAVSRDLQTLRVLIGDNPDQVRLATVLTDQANARVEASNQIVATRQKIRSLPTLAQLGYGKKLMDAARATVAQMEAKEKLLLDMRTRRARAAQRYTSVVIWLGLVLGIAFLSVAGIAVSREIDVGAQARAQVNALNNDLERRVEQRTAALQSEVAARMETEAKLRASEEMFRMLLDGITEYAVYMLDREGRVSSWNSGAARIKGYRAEEIIGSHVSCFYTDADRDLNVPLQMLDEATHRGRFEGQGWRVRKDGSRFWANAIITALYDEDGGLRGYSKVVRDVTDHKKAEDELKKQAALLDLAHDAIIVRDLQSRVVFWNRGAQHVYGWSPGEAVGHVTHDLLQTKFPMPLAEIDVIMASEGDWEGELRHITRHGAEVIVASRWSLQRDEVGAPAAILEINRDITDRKRTEAALGDSEGRLAGIIASAMDAIITVDDEQRIVLFNCAAEKMFRCPEAEAKGQPITRFIPQRFHAAHSDHIQKYSETGVTNRAMGPKEMLWALRADGQEFRIEASISQVVTGGKKLFTVILRDVTERIRADEIRERLAAVVDSSDDAIISKDLDGNINAWNGGAEKLFGYTAPEVLGKPMLILFPPERMEEESDILSRIRQGECVEHFDTVRVRKDGTRINVSVTISPIRDGSGAIVGASKIARDITERKRAEEALSESHARLKKVLEVETVGVLFWDLTTGALRDANNTFLNMMGYSRRDVDAGELTWQKLTPPEYQELSRAELRKYAATGRVGPYEKEYFHKDGTRQWFVFAGSSLEGQSCVEFCVDISDRKKAEAALHESENRFRTLIEQASDAFFLHDSEGRFLEVNRRACESLGYTREELLRMCVFDIEQEVDIPKAQRAWEQAEPGKAYTLQGHQKRKDGTAFPVEVRLSACSIGGQKLHLGLVRDTTERKRAEEALRQKEHLLSESQRIAHIGSWVYDPADPSGAIQWSDELYRLYGVSPETFAPTVESFLSLLVPEDRPDMQKWIAACAAGENAGDFEFRVTLPDGSIRVLMGRGELQGESENNPTLMTGTSQDITERRRAEDALRESEERFQTMANGIPQLAWMAEADGRIFWYNQRWYQYTGTTFEEMEGWAWQTVHDPELLPKVLERWKVAIATGQPFDMEFPLRGADGVFRAFLTRVMPLTNSEGRVVRWFGTNTDISERKEAEERLARQALELSRQTEDLQRSQSALETKTRMLNLVLESVGEGLVAADREGRFLLWNSSASNLLSRGSTSLPPEQWSSHYACYHPDGITPCPMDQLPLVRAMQGESLQKELIIRHANSEDSVILEFSGRPMKDAQGNLCGGVVAFRDITHRKKDEQRIRKLNEELEKKVLQRTAQLEAANHELEAFVYSVSHDLRAPLRHISSFSSILREDFGAAMDAEARRLLERIENGARRMTLLVDGLLSLARFGRRALNISLTELNTIVDGVVSVLRTEYAGRDVEWRIAPLPGLECDPILIQQVFQNLLANALKYTGRRSKAVIEVDSIQKPGKPPVIFVRDNGAGFSMQYADKLFGMFQRMHKDSEFEGTGVGLATVHRIIKKHGGNIWAEAEVDRGATFYFTVGEKASIETLQKTATKKGTVEHAHDGRS